MTSREQGIQLFCFSELEFVSRRSTVHLPGVERRPGRVLVLIGYCDG